MFLMKVTLSKPPLGAAQADADRPDGATAVVIVDEEQSGAIVNKDLSILCH
jgi:hypothetical protein